MKVSFDISKKQILEKSNLNSKEEKKKKNFILEDEKN